MEHPNLTPEETKIVEGMRAELSARLLRERVRADRWAYVALGVVVDLAGEVLKLQGRDTEPPEPLCQMPKPPPRAGVQLHCTLADGHAPPCIFEEWPP